VNVRSGETIVLAGLLSTDESHDVNGIPGLRHLPIIGGFFSSRSKTSEVRELVIFITPEVVEPESALSSAERKIFDKSTRHQDLLRETLPLMD